MPRLAWSDFVHRHPPSHLVAAVLPETEEIGTPQVKASRNLLVRKVRQLAPSGAYAVTVVRAGGPPEIHCAFANESDARVFATAMHAKVIGRYAGYASQRLFRFDDAAASALLDALPPPRLSAKRSQEAAGNHGNPQRPARSAVDLAQRQHLSAIGRASARWNCVRRTVLNPARKEFAWPQT